MATLEQMPAQSVQRQGRTMDDGSIASMPEIQDSTSHNRDGTQGAETRESELFLPLPEDILYHIHAVMPLRDAARAACVSCGFRRSWEFFPNLIFDIESLGINEDVHPPDEITSYFVSTVDHIMQNHSGTGVKTFKLQTYPCDNVHPSYVDRWVQGAITPGIKEFELQLPWKNKIEYNFPCSLLSTERGSSMQFFLLTHCAFHPTAEVGCLSNLTTIDLSYVNITGEELHSFLSNSFVLERLDISSCDNMVHLNIPCLLSKLTFLRVHECERLEMVESSAPNLYEFNYIGHPIHVSLEDPTKLSQMQMLSICKSNMLYRASTKLPSIAPNLQTLFLASMDETIDTPMVSGKFIHLKYLDIALIRPSRSPGYNFCSLVSFLDGSPALETFVLHVELPAIRHDSILECSNSSSLHPRSLSQNSHDRLKNVTITGFCSAKSMIELTNHILEKALSLQCITLDTSIGHDNKSGMCSLMFEEDLIEARRARLAVGRYIQENVPLTVSLKLVEPCSRCLS
ncbi:hypothetical protein ACP4OV_013925 [Aristida adscensionis]